MRGSMESTSDSRPRSSGATGRIKTASSNMYSDNQSLVIDIRKAVSMMKEVAVVLERDNQSQMVKELEDAIIELLETSDECTNFSSVLQTVGNEYQPGPELTNFKKLFDDEITKLKARSTSDPRSHPFLRQFTEAVWNVHHAGQPMPGEEQEDIVMTSTQCSILNNSCPLSGKPVIDLADPVRSVECKHIYDKKAIMHYIKSKNAHAQCPVAGCPKILQPGKVGCDPLLLVEIDEMRLMSRQTARPEVVEDFTALDAEENE